MKYLKLFNESDSSDYYVEVSLSDYEKWRKVRIPQSLVRKIESRLVLGYVCRKITATYLSIESIGSVKLSYMIRMSGDEWYWVDVDNSLVKRKGMASHVYYRCDQEEGLMRLLVDCGLIK